MRRAASGTLSAIQSIAALTDIPAGLRKSRLQLPIPDLGLQLLGVQVEQELQGAHQDCRRQGTAASLESLLDLVV